MKKKNNYFKFFKFFCLICYILLAVVLIAESCINGENSADQSNQVGSNIAELFNNLSSDQAKLVDTTSVTITNKSDFNKINTYDKCQIKMSVEPKNASCSSFDYSSSDNNIATVSKEGMVDFKKEGTVTITATNQKFTYLSDSITVNVSNVEATKIVSYIGSEPTNLSSIPSTYTLDCNTKYKVGTTFFPSNTTDKTLTYTLSTYEYIDIDEDGFIIPKQHSFGKETTITINHKNIYTSINVIVAKKEIIDAVDFEINDLNNEKELNIKINEIKTITPLFTPSNTTYQDIELLTNDTDYLEINKNTIKGLKKGRAKLTIKSQKYAIEKEITVNISEQPEIESFDITTSSGDTLVCGSKAKIEIYNIEPLNASTEGIIFESSNNDIISIDNDNKEILAKNIGEATITAKYKNYEKSLDITIIEKTESSINEFNINEENSTKDYEVGTEYILDEKIEIDINSNFIYSLSDPTFGEIIEDKFTPTKGGITSINIVHKNTGISKSLKINIIYPFGLKDSGNNDIEYSLVYGKESYFSLSDESDGKQAYEISSSSNLTLNKISDKTYSLVSNKIGNETITITPIIDNIKMPSKDYSFEIKESKIGTYLEQGYKLSFDAINKTMTKVNLKYFPISIKSYAYINPILKKEEIITDKNGNKVTSTTSISLDKISNKNINYEMKDESIAKVEIQEDGLLAKIVPVGIGETFLTVTDSVSKDSFTVKVIIMNQVIYTDYPYTIVGNTLNLIANNNYEITNGNSATVRVNFDYEKTTYFDVIYSSDNPSVASINKDGVITTHKEGKVNISIVCWDGISPTTLENISSYNGAIRAKITLTVNKQKLITDFESFFFLVRKGVGHFGAFLILGIFSTFTYMLFFDKKKWIWSCPLNFLQGFALAGITELIQLLVPGRSGLLSDVLIDYSGFLISSVIITIGVILYYFIKQKKNKILDKE